MRSALLVCLCFVLASATVSCQATSASDGPDLDVGCANPALPPRILASTATAAAVEAAGRTKLAVTTATAPEAKLTLAVAKDQTSRELGLMCVLRLAEHGGMVFIFDKSDRQEFWMKNTLISLDMIWVRADGVVDTVAANVPQATRTTPDDKLARRAGFGKYVIELAGGEARRDGIVRGSKLDLTVR